MTAYRQYVNLDPTRANELAGLDPLRAGRTITAVAKLKRPRAGIIVEFQLAADPGNVEPGVDSANLSWVEWARGRPTGVLRTAVTDAQGEARISFTLSMFGGDKFKVTARARKPGGGLGDRLGNDTYTIWRRFYYHTSRFAAGVVGAGWPNAGTLLPAIPPLDMTAVVAEFARDDQKHFIEMVEEAPTVVLTPRHQVLDGGGNLPVTARTGYNATREPVTMRMVLVNQLADSATAQVELRNMQELVATPSDVGNSLWVDESLPFKTDWLISADWRWEAWDTSWKPLPLQHVTATGAQQITVTLPNMGVRNFAADRNLRVRVRYRHSTGSTCGLSWYNTIWIASAFMGSHAVGAVPGRALAKDKRATTIHEAGHFIGMVAANQPTHYVARGHQGPHCSTGLSALDRAQPSYGGLLGTCVMFGEDSAALIPKFCAECGKSVRTREIRLARMPATW